MQRMKPPTKSATLLGGRYESPPEVMAVPVTARGVTAIADVCKKLASGDYPQEEVPCLCGEHQGLCIARVDRYGIPHRTVLCARCALLRTNPRMTRASYQHFYVNHYRAIYERPNHDPDRYFAAQLLRAEQRASHTVRWVRPRMGAAVVEIGCGAGWNLIPYQSRGWRAIGWDVDDGYLELGRRRGLDLRHGLLESACETGESFDLIVLSHVLEHLLDPINDLGLLRDILKPEGLLSIEVPSAFAVSRLDRYFQNAHAWSFVPQTLRAVMESAGYQCVAMNGVIESLWRRSNAASRPIPPNLGLVRRTQRRLAARVEGGRVLGWWIQLGQRLDALREAVPLRRGAAGRWLCAWR